MIYVAMGLIWFLALTGLLTMRWLQPENPNLLDIKILAFIGLLMAYNLFRAFLWYRRRDRNLRDHYETSETKSRKQIKDPHFNFGDNPDPPKSRP